METDLHLLVIKAECAGIDWANNEVELLKDRTDIPNYPKGEWKGTVNDALALVDITKEDDEEELRYYLAEVVNHYAAVHWKNLVG